MPIHDALYLIYSITPNGQWLCQLPPGLSTLGSYKTPDTPFLLLFSCFALWMIHGKLSLYLLTLLLQTVNVLTVKLVSVDICVVISSFLTSVHQLRVPTVILTVLLLCFFEMFRLYPDSVSKGGPTLEMLGVSWARTCWGCLHRGRWPVQRVDYSSFSLANLRKCLNHWTKWQQPLLTNILYVRHASREGG